ncbi:MAG: Retroviral aspartyl protease [Nitrospirae bacterium]|nr:Retroviral aspartyl protease [Nitrospirota bacterium]
MGETRARIKVTGFIPNGSVEIETLVDTGATYTTLPKKSLPAGIRPEREITLELADGRVIRRHVANVLVELEGIRAANPIILGQEGDAVLIGLLTLEACGLSVDPIDRKLFPLPAIHHY